MSDLTTSFKDEKDGKELFRQAYAYAEKLQQYVKGVTDPSDIFKPNVSVLRSKIREKCHTALFLSCSKRRKIEEILWRNVFYLVISVCKQHKEVLDPSHPHHNDYSKHLMESSVYYQQLMQLLQSHYSAQITLMNSKQLEDIDSGIHGADFLWVKKACQHCYIYLGDIARYQIDLGYSLEHSVNYYHQAISLDPTDGWPYNQLAALSESNQRYLDALYYYLRSSSSIKPFSGVDRNIARLFEKNSNILQNLKQKQESIQEPDITSFNKQLFIAKFIYLQQIFHTSSMSRDDNISSEITGLCSSIVNLLEFCLEHDYKLHLGLTDDKSVISSKVLLDFPFLLKMSGLSFLPAYSQRLKGSGNTVIASAFALSILSLIINYTLKRIVGSTITCLKEKISIDEVIESEKTMVQLLLDDKNDGNISQTTLSTVSSRSKGTRSDSSSQKSSTKSRKAAARMKAEKRKKALKVMNKRRRQHRKSVDGSSVTTSSSSEGEESSDTGGEGSFSDNMESLGEDIDLLMIESLSESSSEEDDQVGGVNQSMIPSPPPPGGTTSTRTTKSRRNVVIAANFSKKVSPLNNSTSSNSSLVPNPSNASSSSSLSNIQSSRSPTSMSEDTTDLRTLQLSTNYHEMVSKACDVISKEKYLQCVKVFADWLVSYPSVLASCGQMSSTIWSRLADLVNFIPCETDLMEAGIAIDLTKSDSCTTWTQTCAFHEDDALRGFDPLIRVHQHLLFQNELPLELKQGISRIQCLIKFAHYVVNSKTTPSFTYDKSTERFMSSTQVEREQKRETQMKLKTSEEKAQANRSKLMKAMAEQRLKTEVDALTVATAKKKASLFTPYLLPDALTLSSNLHLIKKLIKSKNFVIIIAKSVIESLDIMKKERSNYGAREAIKFLEKELHDGNRFLRAQKDTETTATVDAKRRPHKEDMDSWLFSQLVDCAIYFNCYSSGGATPSTNPSEPLLTMLLDKSLVRALDITDSTRGTPPPGRQPPAPIDPKIMKLLSDVKHGGVEVQTAYNFHQRWQQQSQKITK